ncbi:polysaccharide deacetylase [Advenella kashmirensis WT001]|uniref:Polysaccharide deacetylase n=2 Tax=Advenella kashmirensis TaxID=310575 RepID=I3UEV3_ADVKW|nr:polysaccharide deacetylase [Advenella kashmirensis WT001]
MLPRDSGGSPAHRGGILVRQYETPLAGPQTCGAIAHDNKHSMALRHPLQKRYICMLDILRVLFVLIMVAGSCAQAKQISVSFDDGLNPDTNPEAVTINQALLSQLGENNIQAIIYPSLIKLGGSAGLQLVAQWGMQGHAIGNHSERHLNLNKEQVSVADYIAGIAGAERQLQTLPGWTARYRFPFLKEGDTRQKRDAVRQWLNDRGYRSAAVSIDASDWFYNIRYLAYEKAGKTDSLARLKKAYIRHLLDRADYYDDLGKKTLGYSPKHVILLHTNKINAQSLSDIIAAFKAHGWEWIDPETAYADPLYRQQPDVIPAGESIIWSIAKNNGNTTLRYPAEDAPYEFENLRRFGLE